MSQESHADATASTLPADQAPKSSTTRQSAALRLDFRIVGELIDRKLLHNYFVGENLVVETAQLSQSRATQIADRECWRLGWAQ